MTYRNKVSFVKLYQLFVLPHSTIADKELLEKVQRRAIIIITNLKGTYKERLAILGMRSLCDRRLRGDLI